MTGLILRLTLFAVLALCLSSCAVTVPIGDRAKFGSVRVEYLPPDLAAETIGQK